MKKSVYVCAIIEVNDSDPLSVFLFEFFSQLSEIALIRMRGTFTMMNQLTIYAALIYSVVLSACFSVKILIVMSAIPTIIFLMTSYILPESPMWLMKKGICTHLTNLRFEVNKKFHGCDIVHSIPIYM